MKQLILFLLLTLQLSVVCFAEIKVKKSTFAAFERGTIQSEPKSALNTHTGQTLVVWEKVPSEERDIQILGRFVDRNGISSNKTLKIVSNPGALNPRPAYNPITKEFLLIYDTLNIGAADIYTIRLNSRGKKLGTAIKVTSSNAFANVVPRIIFNPVTGGFTAIWLQVAAKDDRDNGLVGVSLDEKGRPDGPIVMIERSVQDGVYNEPIPLDLDFQPTEERVLVLFQRDTGTRERDFWLASLDPLMRKVKRSNIAKINEKPVKRDSNSGRDFGACLSLFPDESGTVFYTDVDGIKKRRFTQAGKPSGNISAAFNSIPKNTSLFDPTVTFSKTSNGTIGLLIALDGRFQIAEAYWAQILDASGNAAGNPIQLNGIAPGANVRFGSELAALPLANIFKFSWFGTQIHDNRSGILKLNLTVP